MAQRQTQYQDVAREISAGPVDVIVTACHPPAVAAKRATSKVPIIALAVVNPVGAGFAASLSRPGGNLTGLSLEVTPETNVKMLQLLREAIPDATRLGVLWNSANPGSEFYLDVVRKAAKPLNVALEARDVNQQDDIAVAFRSLKGNVDGLVIFPEPLLWTYRRLVVDEARTTGLPTIFGYRDAAEIGGLMSYGPDLVELFRQGARYVDKVLKGTPPAELPVELPTTFELVINLNAAKALGVTIPTSLLLRADHTIE
jgi:putative tryptophan/tyrosine transport system substrate-binding protein